MKRPFFQKLGSALSGSWLRRDKKPAVSSGGGNWADSDEEVSLAFEDVLSEDAGRFGETLRVISLAAFRAAVGDDWERLSHKIMMISESIIQRGMGQGNVYGRRGTDMFVLCFSSSVPDAEARYRASVITEEIARKIIGAQFSSHSVPLVHMAEVSKTEALSGDGLDDDLLARSVAAVQARDEGPGKPRGLYHLADPNRPSPEGPNLHVTQGVPGQPTGPALHTTQISAQDRQPGELRAHLKVSEGQTPTAEPQGPRLALQPTKPLEKSEPPPPPKPIAPPPVVDPLQAVKLTFLPAWNRRTQAIDTFVGFREGKPPGSAGDALARFDARVLTLACGHLEGAARHKAALVVPVSYSSLAAHRRPLLFAALESGTEALRLLYLSLEITDVPFDAGPQDVTILVRALRAVCAGVFIRTNLDNPRIDLFAPSEPDAVGVAMESGDQTASAHANPVPLITKFIREAQNSRTGALPTYFWDLRRRPHVIGAVLSGAAYVGGAALMRPQPAPGRTIPVPQSKFEAQGTKG